MRKILIFGNSGSGKSTLAKKWADAESLAHLDLDTLAWLPTIPPQRAPVEQSKSSIEGFMTRYQSWVIEGCYADLLDIASAKASEIIFLNLSIDQCIKNARARPWEPHKYESAEAQDKNLEMLIEWIKQYETRDDVFSHDAHLKFYENFDGKKTILRNNT